MVNPVIIVLKRWLAALNAQFLLFAHNVTEINILFLTEREDANVPITTCLMELPVSRLARLCRGALSARHLTTAPSAMEMLISSSMGVTSASVWTIFGLMFHPAKLVRS